jgi:hypothetical protein
MLGYGRLRAVVALPGIDRRDKGTALAAFQVLQMPRILTHAVLDRPRSIRRVFSVRLFLMLVSDAPKDHDGMTKVLTLSFWTDDRRRQLPVRLSNLLASRLGMRRKKNSR